MSYSVNLSAKAMNSIVEAIEFRLQQYKNQLTELTDENEISDDCARIEKICDRLFSLLDCICADSNEWTENVDELEKITSWETAQTKLLESGFEYEAIAIEYEPTKISPTSDNLGANHYPESWDARPEKWIVNLYNFQESEFGFGYNLTSAPIYFEMQISRRRLPLEASEQLSPDLHNSTVNTRRLG